MVSTRWELASPACRHNKAGRVLMAAKGRWFSLRCEARCGGEKLQLRCGDRGHCVNAQTGRRSLTLLMSNTTSNQTTHTFDAVIAIVNFEFGL